MQRPTPHRDKLQALLVNPKLPASDVPRVEAALLRYNEWIAELTKAVANPSDVCDRLVMLLNEYKLYIDIELIFDSDHDFLYRQKGQLKLDNSIIEEFLSWLMCPALVPELDGDFLLGPARCFSALTFVESIKQNLPGGGIRIREKDQDFAVSRPIHLMASHYRDFSQSMTAETFIAYIAAEIKTNLDKTMFQEASTTAHDVKSSVAGARYYVLCEWLDMVPLSTAATDIDEILILRGAKRIGSNLRKHFVPRDARKKRRSDYVAYLHAHPFRSDVFQRFADHIRAALGDRDPAEDDALSQGYF